jgi:hypothetical protein
MKNFDTLVELGIEQAIADHVGHLLKIYMTPNEPQADERFTAGLKRLLARYERVKALIEEMM